MNNCEPLVFFVCPKDKLIHSCESLFSFPHRGTPTGKKKLSYYKKSPFLPIFFNLVSLHGKNMDRPYLCLNVYDALVSLLLAALPAIPYEVHIHD